MLWGPQQDRAMRECSRWIADPSTQVFYLAGFAGTGKTTLAKYLVETSSAGRWLFAAYTGKAAHVLRQKGCYDASTIHSLIYRPAGETQKDEVLKIEQNIRLIETLAISRELSAAEKKYLTHLEKSLERLLRDKQPQFSLWANSPLADVDVDGIVVDEVSMVDAKIGQDLESFNKKILVLGDPAQLPPVGAAGYFTKRKPDVMLTEIHRHARESNILRLATLIREGGSINEYSGTEEDCLVIRKKDPDYVRKLVFDADQVLVGLNETRRIINHRYREVAERNERGPVKDDRLVCLRNDHQLGLFNGSQWRVNSADNDYDSMISTLDVSSEEDSNQRLEVEGWLHHMLGQELVTLTDRRDYSEFDWSYALTVHKAQGSQWDNVLLFDQSKSFKNSSWRWLYTGITRAAKKLKVLI